jgi:hypothetical protein
MKTTLLSVRVTDDDAAFLAGLELKDAKTPSEKLRALLLEARRREDNHGDFVASRAYLRELFEKSFEKRYAGEFKTEIKSEVLDKIYERGISLAATLYAGPTGFGDARIWMREHEGRLLDEAFALIREVLHLGLLSETQAHDPQAVQKRLAPILELADLVRLSRERREARGDRQTG